MPLFSGMEMYDNISETKASKIQTKDIISPQLIPTVFSLGGNDVVVSVLEKNLLLML